MKVSRLSVLACLFALLPLPAADAPPVGQTDHLRQRQTALAGDPALLAARLVADPGDWAARAWLDVRREPGAERAYQHWLGTMGKPYFPMGNRIRPTVFSSQTLKRLWFDLPIFVADAQPQGTATINLATALAVSLDALASVPADTPADLRFAVAWHTCSQLVIDGPDADYLHSCGWQRTFLFPADPADRAVALAIRQRVLETSHDPALLIPLALMTADAAGRRVMERLADQPGFAGALAGLLRSARCGTWAWRFAPELSDPAWFDAWVQRCGPAELIQAAEILLDDELRAREQQIYLGVSYDHAGVLLRHRGRDLPPALAARIRTLFAGWVQEGVDVLVASTADPEHDVLDPVAIGSVDKYAVWPMPQAAQALTKARITDPVAIRIRERILAFLARRAGEGPTAVELQAESAWLRSVRR